MTPIDVMIWIVAMALANAILATYNAQHARHPDCPEPRRNGWRYQCAGAAGTLLMIVAGLRALKYQACMAWTLAMLATVAAIFGVNLYRAVVNFRRCNHPSLRRWRGGRRVPDARWWESDER
jgi:hypothetical protein